MRNREKTIELTGIVKRFYIGKPHELEILHGIDLTVYKGEFVSIVGASGSGKRGYREINSPKQGQE